LSSDFYRVVGKADPGQLLPSELISTTPGQLSHMIVTTRVNQPQSTCAYFIIAGYENK